MAVTHAVMKRQQRMPAGDGRAARTTDRRPSHWRELHDPATGRLIACRPAGSPAGTWPHTPWWHCTFHDKYERVNFWSHFVPGLLLLLLAALAAQALVPGHQALAVWGVCSGATHMFSALTHVYPDSHKLEKLDHLGIVATIVAVPLTALMAQEHDHVPTPMVYVTLLLIASAFLSPLPRTLGFVGGGAICTLLYGRQLASLEIAAELALYVGGAVAFLRNGGHHYGRPHFLTDHHLLHYFVTVASGLQIHYILTTLQPQ